MTYRWIYLSLCLGLWLVPFFFTGWTQRAWQIFPRAMNFQQSTAALFTRGVKTWYACHLEWKRADGTWFETKKRLLFPAVTFGERTRFDRIVSQSDRRAFQEQILFKLSIHAMDEGREHGLLPEDVAGLRLVNTYWEVGSPELAQPKGAWNPPEAATLPENRRRVVAEYRIEKGQLTRVKEAAKPQMVQTAPPKTSAPKKVPLISVTPLKPPPERRLVPPSQEAMSAKDGVGSRTDQLPVNPTLPQGLNPTRALPAPPERTLKKPSVKAPPIPDSAQPELKRKESPKALPQAPKK
jgi:hypothetical protein